MQKRFRACDLNQIYLLPPSHHDWLPEDHLARFVAAVGQLFLQSLRLCQKAGLIKLGTIALDGTKIAATASRQRRKAEEPRATAMRARLRDEKELAKYRKRAGLVEPVFGITKEHRYFRRFLLRGIDKVQGEWSFACASFNLWRMFRRGYEPQMA